MLRGVVTSLFKAIAVVILILFVVPFVLFGILWGDMANRCWEDSEAVANARSLSPARLQVLYEDMKTLARSAATPMQGYARAGGVEPPIPAEFVDLTPARVRPKQGQIMLEGCLDAFVFLRFEGIRDTTELPSIVLTLGDHHESGSEVLWTQ